MPRPYSQKFLLELDKNDGTGLGILLARVCVAGNLPATYVAGALNISRMTVYSWFRGSGVRELHRSKVEAFMDLVKQDFETGRLPAKNHRDAKTYISELTGGDT